VRKILIVALREYNAAVRTKAFVFGLLMMPIMMGGSLVFQWLLKDIHDTRDRRFAVINLTGHSDLFAKLQAAVEAYNATAIYEQPEKDSQETDDLPKKQIKPRFVLEEQEPAGDTKEALDNLREELSERVREGGLFGVVEIDPRAFAVKPHPVRPRADKGKEEETGLRYQSNRPTYIEFPYFIEGVINQIVQEQRGKEAHMDIKTVLGITQPVHLVSKGLSKRNPVTGEVEDTSKEAQWGSIAVPFGMLFLMFMVIMMSATPLMQGVVEEKMQRIAEVLLGSVRPFDLMMGKLLGMSAVSLTITAVYLTGIYWAAYHFDSSEYVGGGLLGWFFVFQSLAALMYGSLFIAIGAACTDMKETQNLLWPVMLLACLPMFVVVNVLQEPNNPVATGLSFFPFASPMLMVARMAVPPGIPWWQPLVAVGGALLTTVLCVYVAGRIFRVGLLMQGKGAKLGELVQWVIRG
jgi:ABC-2 type transport system permease protein